MGIDTVPAWNLKNIIGIPILDTDVHHKMSLTWFPNYEILVFDPGEMVGWAGIAKDRMSGYTYIEVGQGPWHECLRFEASTVYVESTPFAARRTFDPWPIRFDGAVRAKLHPKIPLPVSPTTLKVARKWFSLPRKHELGRHAKDALTHLIGVLAKQS